MRTPSLIAFAAAGLAAPYFAFPADAATLRIDAQVPPPKIIEFNDLPMYQHLYYATCIAAGPDGNLWITDDIDQDAGTSVIARVTTGGKLTGAFQYGQNSATPSGTDITAGPNGDLWIVDSGDEQIVRMTTKGVYKRFPLNSPGGITAGPDGNVWFTYFGSPTGGVGKITPAGKMTLYSNGITGSPIDITTGPDGALWFAEYEGRIGRIDTSGNVTEYSMGITPNSQLRSIVTGPDGNLWFTEQANHAVARITLAGVATEFTSGITGDPYDLATGRGEVLWFTEYKAAKIGRITTRGQAAEYSKGITRRSEPACIVKGPDANMWFVETATNFVGRVDL